MTETTRRSLAFDLLETDLSDFDELSRLVIDHTIAPVRALVGLPAPRRNEGRWFMFSEPRFEDGIEVRELLRADLPRTSACFDVVVRSLLLFGWLFPGNSFLSEAPSFALDAPGSAVLDDYFHLIDRPQEAVENLVAGLLGLPIQPVEWHGSRPSRPARNDAALSELASVQALLSRAIDPVEDEEYTTFVDIGLDRMEWLTARDVDRAMREHVQRRLVWFGTMEPIDVLDDGFHGILTYDRGVFAADVPDSLTGLVLLDFSEQLQLDRRVARCGHCRRLMAVNARQAGRARKGQPVYHADCLDAHRLGYYRRKSRDRYARIKGETRP